MTLKLPAMKPPRLSLSGRLLFCALLTGWLWLAPAQAIEVKAGPVAVVELFTSQGCSRCPDADRFLAELGDREDIVALAYHIDYWDYTGWEDTFASAENTALQKAYAQAWGKNRIYTPQMVVNGTHGLVGTNRGEVNAAIGAGTAPLELAYEPTGPDTVKFTIPPRGGFGDAVIWLVTFRESASVVVERGENSGRALDYSHIVLSRQAVGMWDAAEGAEFSLPLTETLGGEADGAVVLVQEKKHGMPGRILGALAVKP